MIRELIQQRASEELFLDFKRAATLAQHNRLQPDDRENHAKALSGFGNTAGGVILWGVDCRNMPDDGDIARSLFPVPHADRFKSWLEADISGATTPSHVGVQHAVCHRNPDGAGFVATLIPAADHGPLQVPTLWRYYMRAGSSFVPIPHLMLAAMFGRRPTPQFRIDCDVVGPVGANVNGFVSRVEFTAFNEGLGIARDLFLVVRVVSHPESASIVFALGDDRRLQVMHGKGNSRTVMSEPHAAFPPGDQIRMASVQVALTDPVNGPLQIDVSVGCGNGPAAHLRLSQSSTRLRHTMSLLRQASNPDTVWLAQRVFGLAKEDEQ